MKGLFLKFPFSQNKVISLQYLSPYINYTYLDIRIHQIADINYLISALENPQPILKYAKQLTSNTNLLQKFNQSQSCEAVLQSSNLLDLQKPIKNIEKNQQTQQESRQSDVLTMNELIKLKQLSLKHEQMNEFLLRKVSSNNLGIYMQIANSLRCVDLCLWQKMCSLIRQQFRSGNLQMKEILLNELTIFIEKSFFSYNNYYKSRMIYSRSFLADLHNFPDLIRLILSDPDIFRFQTAQDQFTQQQNHLRLKIINHFCIFHYQLQRNIQINYLQMKQWFLKYSPNFQKVLQICDFEQLINLIRYFSSLRYENSKFKQTIQNRFEKIMLGEQLNQKQISNELSNRNMNIILNSWMINREYNEKIYNEILRPKIMANIEADAHYAIYPSMLMNIVGAGIQDPEMYDKILSKTMNNFLLQTNRELHVLIHYFSVINKTKPIKTKYECQQNPVVLKYLKKNKCVIHSKCLQTYALENKQKVRDGDKNVGVSNKKRKNMQKINEDQNEFNEIEGIWINIVRSAFEELCKKYKKVGEESQMLVHVPFCIYQIDVLIILAGKAIAVEISGHHYFSYRSNEDQIEEDNHEQLIGKKLIRKKIIESYGIKQVRINCHEEIIKYISKLRQFEQGKDYAFNLIEQAFLEP